MKQASSKSRQLAAHKRLATGLFLLMLLLYASMVWLEHANPATWIGYVKAFSEAAMVGALADWFAVTALFHHPLGLPIPHTNLIEKGKKAIGDNLGAFVVSNFLTPATIRPYIEKLEPSGFAASWLEKERNQVLFAQTIRKLLRDILSRLEDRVVVTFIARKGGALLGGIRLNQIAGKGLEYVVNRSMHEELVTTLAVWIAAYIEKQEGWIREKVNQESYFFIPKFIDRKLAEKISSGLSSFFREVAENTDHPLRAEVRSWLLGFAVRMQEEDRWEAEFRRLGAAFLSSGKLESYVSSAWTSLKAQLTDDLNDEGSAPSVFIERGLNNISKDLSADKLMQQKIDGWIRYTAYKNILRNVDQVGALISSTIGNWEGAELSQKLELEVGKDLQFIRINGTLVGGMVGLLIYSVTRFFLSS